MKKITKIVPQEKNPKRLSIYVDGEFAFGLFEKKAESLNLQVGMLLTQEDYEELLQIVQLEKAKFTAMAYLSRGAKTSYQVKNKLKEKEYAPEIIEEVLMLLKKYRYIDDTDFLKRYIENQMVYNKKSKRKVIYELYQKGIDKIDWDEITLDIENLENTNIRYYLEKYRLEKAPDLKQKDKIIRRLLSKGFSYEKIRKNMYNFWEKLDQ